MNMKIDMTIEEKLEEMNREKDVCPKNVCPVCGEAILRYEIREMDSNFHDYDEDRAIWGICLEHGCEFYFTYEYKESKIVNNVPIKKFTRFEIMDI